MANPYSWNTGKDEENGNSDGDLNWSEGQAPSTVNDSSRAQLASHARLYKAMYGGITSTGVSGFYALSTQLENPGLTLAAGVQVGFKANHSSAASGNTLNVDATGAKPILTTSGDAIAAGSIPIGGIVKLAYDPAGDGGTGAWQLLGSGAGAISADKVSFEPFGDIEATDVQAAIEELDTGLAAKPSKAADETITGVWEHTAQLIVSGGGSQSSPQIKFAGHLHGFYSSTSRVYITIDGAHAATFYPSGTDVPSINGVITREKGDARYALIGSGGDPQEDIAAGAIGQYILGRRSNAASSYGATYPGSSILPAAADGASTPSPQAGTWLCLGNGRAGVEYGGEATLFMRIS